VANSNPGRLSGRVAIVTGAGQGAGYGAAVHMAREGAAVVLVGRTLSKLEATAARIAELGGRSLPCAGDVTRQSDIDAAVALAIERFGRIDILVCAAQSPQSRWGDLDKVTDAEIDELWKSGAVATLAFMRAVRPHMQRAGGGSIINFGSGTQHNPAHYGVYAAVKAAIQTLSRAAAVEWGPDNIRVNVVIPLVASPALAEDAAVHGVTQEDLVKRRPLRWVGDPERDIGPAIGFLAGDDSRYITGSVLALDGGVTYLR
jgi:NAD(P)-dependent dehydrogenase (short-subunit alcohol dehydrogenase family)